MSNPLEIAGNPFRVSLIDKDRGVVAYVLFDSYVRLFAAAPIGDEIVELLEKIDEAHITEKDIEDRMKVIYALDERLKLAIRRYRAVCPKEE